jgi:hypothetical protein
LYLFGFHLAHIKIIGVFGWFHDFVGNVVPNLHVNHLRIISYHSQLVEPDISQNGEEPAFRVTALSWSFSHRQHATDRESNNEYGQDAPAYAAD